MSENCENTLELGAKNLRKGQLAYGISGILPLLPAFLSPRTFLSLGSFSNLSKVVPQRTSQVLKGNVLGKVAWPLQQCMEPTRPCHRGIIYILNSCPLMNEFFKSCAEISGSHHHHLPVHVRRPGRPKEMLRMPILSSFWMCKNLAKSNPKSAVHPFPSNGNGRTVWIFGMPHSQMILHGVSRALGRDVGCLKPKKASCAELPAAKR